MKGREAKHVKQKGVKWKDRLWWWGEREKGVECKDGVQGNRKRMNIISVEE